MKKQILNLGKALNRAEQKGIKGGSGTVNPWDTCFCLLQDKFGNFYANIVDCYGTCPGGTDPLQY
ncbi:hypothetical protein C7447_101954 [Tenacibaculum adriaticum]|uniref:Uncharacterized protein n=1 Tax=Tenacibaculum adriaticum TaxID=413713 RepID=A0A5S5DWX0_9FLAO|nr:hypothetical protein [Tenacibaculum adriaticum]TYQ00342.1 hypothetical protein C7447_101954 [Tenacibaculum adriaticum]